MIANDWRRSVEFFQNPKEAGAEARYPVFSTGGLLGFLLLRAILIALVNYALFQWINERTTSRETNEQVDPTQQMALDQFNELMNLYYSSPLFTSILGFSVSLIFTTFLWQIGRALSGSDISWIEAMSAFVRYMLVTAFFSILLTLAFILTGFGIFSFIGMVLQIYFLFVFASVAQGALELKSYGQSILVFILSGLALLGMVSLLSLLLGAFL